MSAVSRAKVEQTAIVWPDRALCSAAASVDVETDAKVQTMIREGMVAGGSTSATPQKRKAKRQPTRELNPAMERATQPCPLTA